MSARRRRLEQAEDERSLGQGMVESHGQEDVGGLEGLGRAGRSARSRDALHVQVEEHGLALDELHAEAGVVREPDSRVAR